MALAIRRGHEHADIGSQDFGLRVTEETLGRSAEGQHFSPFVDDDHRIGNSRQGGAKMRLAVAQSAFGRALGGNVADDDGKAAERSVQVRSEERHVGNEWVSTSRSRWSPERSKKKKRITTTQT